MKKTAVVLLLSMLVLMSAFCGGGKEAATTSTTSSTVETAGTLTDTGSVKSAEIQENVKYKDTIIIGVANDITTLDPQGSNTDANMMAFYLTHETLVDIDPDTGDVIPALAESWTVSDDGCTFVFTLPENATFTDGTRVTSEDVKYTYEKAHSSSFAKMRLQISQKSYVSMTHTSRSRSARLTRTGSLSWLTEACQSSARLHARRTRRQAATWVRVCSPSRTGFPATTYPS